MEYWRHWQRVVLLIIFSVFLWFVGNHMAAAVYGRPASAPPNSAVSLANAGPRVLLWMGLVVVWAAGSWYILRSGRRSDP